MENKDYPVELVDLEGYFLDNYEEMNKFIIFFKKVQEIFNSDESINVKELNLTRNVPKTSKVLPFSYIISIHSKEYLFFLKNRSTPTLTSEELEEYKNLFSNNISQVGLIIVWNDSNLSSIKLYRDEIYKSYEKIMEIIDDIDRRLSLEELFKREIRFRDRFLKVLVPPPEEEITAMKIPNLEREFNESLNESYNYNKSRRFQEPKISIMKSIDIEDFRPIYSLFSDFISEKFEMMEIDEIIQKLNMTEEEE